MYTLGQLRYAIKYPKVAFRELNRLYHTRFYTRSHNPNGTKIFQEDWDNLLLLDACRYDLYQEVVNNSEPTEARSSVGSATNEFLRGNVPHSDLSDTVYVTSNPMLYNENIDHNFYDIVNTWGHEGWDRDHQTVLPETVTKAALETERKFPHKRLLVHYLQPHHPFIGTQTKFDKESPDADKTKFWLKILSGELDVDRDTVWDAYKQNLERALPSLKKASEHLLGKTVITSDHGNMIGDRSSPIPIREWGHPDGTYSEELVKVPWVEIDRGPRKEVKATNSSTQNTKIEDKTVKDRLEHLGYT